MLNDVSKLLVVNSTQLVAEIMNHWKVQKDTTELVHQLQPLNIVNTQRASRRGLVAAAAFFVQ